MRFPGLQHINNITDARRATGWVPNADLSAAESASTLFRFFRSTHVRDLKLICAVAIVVFLSHFALVLLIGLLDALNLFFFQTDRPQRVPWASLFLSPPKDPGLRDRAVTAVSEFISFVFRYVGPGLPIYGVIIAWAYQSASKRLGIVKDARQNPD